MKKLKGPSPCRKNKTKISNQYHSTYLDNLRSIIWGQENTIHINQRADKDQHPQSNFQRSQGSVDGTAYHERKIKPGWNQERLKSRFRTVQCDKKTTRLDRYLEKTKSPCRRFYCIQVLWGIILKSLGNEPAKMIYFRI